MGVIDFDDCGWGYFLYDLAPLMGNLADFPRYDTLRRAVLDGYREVRELPSPWERDLPALMAARHVAACLWAAGRVDESPGGPGLAEHVAVRMRLLRDCLALEDAA